MNIDNIIIGTFVGIMIIGLFMPILVVVGFNKLTSLLLLYALPLTGAVAGFVLSIGSQKKDLKIEKRDEYLSDLIGRWVIIHTKMGSTHKGKIRSYDKNLIALDNAIRLDIPNSETMDHLFIDKNDVKRIETVNEKIVI